MSMKISVITVCYNSALTIENTLESAALQRYKDFEYLIVNGGSTDGSLEIIRSWIRYPVRLIAVSE